MRKDVELLDSFHLVIDNTFFKKETEKSITYMFGDCAAMIDNLYISTEENVDECKKYKHNSCRRMFCITQVTYYGSFNGE